MDGNNQKLLLEVVEFEAPGYDQILLYVEVESLEYDSSSELHKYSSHLEVLSWSPKELDDSMILHRSLRTVSGSPPRHPSSRYQQFRGLSI